MVERGLGLVEVSVESVEGGVVDGIGDKVWGRQGVVGCSVWVVVAAVVAFVVLFSAMFIAEMGMLMMGSWLCSRMSGRICANLWWLPWLREEAELVSSVVEEDGWLRGGEGMFTLVA